MVSITTAVTRHTQTVNFWADFEQDIADMTIND